jgi:HAD superfamily hydrolase (TIGR01549 family)
MFEAVIFDWDGTLADTRRVTVASFQKALSALPCNIDDEFIERRIGIGSAETFREILRYKNMKSDEPLIARLVAGKTKAEVELSSEIGVFEGALELLESLYGKVKMGLASMNNRDVIDHALKAVGIRGFFNVVLTAEDVCHSKPNPEIFLQCAAKLESDPSVCAVLEDSIFGVEAAKKAGMSCVAVPTGAYSREELEKAKPDFIVDSLKQYREILDFINQ